MQHWALWNFLNILQRGRANWSIQFQFQRVCLLSLLPCTGHDSKFHGSNANFEICKAFLATGKMFATFGFKKLVDLRNRNSSYSTFLAKIIQYFTLLNGFFSIKNLKMQWHIFETKIVSTVTKSFYIFCYKTVFSNLLDIGHYHDPIYIKKSTLLSISYPTITVYE